MKRKIKVKGISGSSKKQEGPNDISVKVDNSRDEIVNPVIVHGHHMVKGQMGHEMEDFLVAEVREVDGHELRLYAIFDGHSGQGVAKYLQSHLFDNILRQPDFWVKPKRALMKAYEVTDDEILERKAGSRGGSTAVTAILIDKRMLFVANVGDSRAILCRDGDVKQLTVDHEPMKEKDLVEERGGFVSRAPGNVPRVDGQLAMTRAFGDSQVKDHITAEPDMATESIDACAEFLVLASDGLWKVMCNEEVYDLIRDFDDPQEAAEALVDEAVSIGSRDDISSIVVMFCAVGSPSC